MTTTPADLPATLQMAADLEHAERMGHRMGTPERQGGEPGWRDLYWSACGRCRHVLIVYCGERPAHSWGSTDLPCRGPL